MDSLDDPTVVPRTPIDYSSALRWVDGDRSLLAELAEVFVQDCPQRMKELEEAVKGGNADLIRQAAHSVKGMVSGFGAHQAKSLAQEMEHLGRSGRLLEACNLLPAVMLECSRVIDALKTADWQRIT
jgi:HPt (histidine-containing phosphotransfer) domain-containing protein